MTRFCVGDPIPLVLTRTELAEGLGYTEWQIDEFRRLNNHPAIKPLDAPGHHPRFDGRAVKHWLDGGAQEPKRRQHFQRARQTRATLPMAKADLKSATGDR